MTQGNDAGCEAARPDDRPCSCPAHCGRPGCSRGVLFGRVTLIVRILRTHGERMSVTAGTTRTIARIISLMLMLSAFVPVAVTARSTSPIDHHVAAHHQTAADDVVSVSGADQSNAGDCPTGCLNDHAGFCPSDCRDPDTLVHCSGQAYPCVTCVCIDLAPASWPIVRTSVLLRLSVDGRPRFVTLGHEPPLRPPRA